MNENKEIILEFVQPTGWSSVDTAEEIRKKLVEMMRILQKMYVLLLDMAVCLCHMQIR